MASDPLYTCAHHQRREASLVYHHRVFDDCEIHIRDLKDVPVQVAFENALPCSFHKRIRACVEIRLPCAIFKTQTGEKGRIHLRSFEERRGVN